MGIVFRQSIKATIINFAGAALGALIVYLSTRFLSTSQYGFNKNIINIAAVAQIFISFGSANTIYMYIQRFDDQPEKRKMLFTLGLLTPVITTVILSIPYLLLQRQVVGLYKPEDRLYVAVFYLYIPVMIWIWSTIQTLEQYLWTRVKVAITSFFREIVLRLINILLLILFILKIISFHFFIAGIVLMYLLLLLGLVAILIRANDWQISFRWKVFSIKEYKEILHFSWYHMLLGLSLNLMGYVDAIMLGPLSGMSSVAVYTTAIYIVTLLNLPYRAMSSASMAALNATFLEGNFKKLNDLFHRSAINIFIVTLGMAAIIICNLFNATRILSPSYNGIISLCLILIIGRLVDMATGLNTELMSISQHYKISFRISMALIVLLIVFYSVLIPTYGMAGAAWGSTLSLIIFNILKIYFLWKKLQIQPFTKNIVLVIIAGIAACVPGYLIPKLPNPFADATIRAGCIAFIYVLMLLWLKPSSDLNNYIQAVKSNKKIF